MIHPARRRATLPPARRGMRAPWLRRRVPDESAPLEPPEVTAPTAGDPAPAAAEEPSRTAAPVPKTREAIRPAFDHPTF